MIWRAKGAIARVFFELRNSRVAVARALCSMGACFVSAPLLDRAKWGLG